MTTSTKNSTPIEEELETMYDSCKSFYGKAIVKTYKDGDKELISYDTHVASIENDEAIVYGTYSQTTLRHIKEFLKQNGFVAINKRQIEEDYMM